MKKIHSSYSDEEIWKSMSKTEQTLFAKKISNYIKSNNNRFHVIRYGDIRMYKVL